MTTKNIKKTTVYIQIIIITLLLIFTLLQVDQIFPAYIDGIMVNMITLHEWQPIIIKVNTYVFKPTEQ